MIVNIESLRSLFTGFDASFTKGFKGAELAYNKVAMTVPSSTRENTYGWMGQFPNVREWIGDRIIKNLSATSFTIVNRSFENTVAVKRTQIEDDQFGIFAPIMEEMGRSCAEVPDRLIFNLAKNGWTTLCYDGQFFFDVDHPVLDPESGLTVSTSNTDGGTGRPWFLLDTSRPLKPFIYQERLPYKLTSLTNETDENVFLRDEYIYGSRGRSNVGYGLWQLAWGSKQTLDAAHYEAARAGLAAMRGDEGRPLGVRPTLLVTGTLNEAPARKLLMSEYGPGGETNPWKGTAELLLTPWLD